jgi:hypothetical protein
MARLDIPPRYRAGLALIRDLDADTTRLISDALDSIPALKSDNSSSPPNLEESVMNSLANIPKLTKTQFRTITEALLSLYGVKASRELPLEEFVEAISDAQESLQPENARWTPDDKKKFQSTLAALLSAKMFGLATKIIDLRTEDEHVFCHARIITDLRPVFSQNIEDGPQGMIIVNLLKVAYHDSSSEHSELMVSLTADDLQTLRKIIDRAEAKARSLKSHMSNVRLFGTGRD